MRFISSIFRFQAKYLFVLLLFAVALATQQWSNIIKVLGVGQSAPQFFVSADKEGQQRGGLIALSSADEPAVELTSWQTEGVAEVTLYPINREQLLTYLLHTDDSSQLSRGFDTSSLEKVATLEHTVSRYSENPNKLVLPLTSTGMWYMQIRIGDVLDDVVIVRSRIGGVAKEHDQGLLVWGQHFETKRHLEEGTVTLYSLMNTVQVVGSGSLGSDGIATLPLPVKTDIAVLSTGDDFAVIPVNLEHLNVGYSYNRFVSSERKHSYFVFVDRPLYKPGDTLYYKAMIRDDNDARYSVAQGSALVQIYKSGSELETIYERTVPLSSLGSFDGVFNLPDTASPGQYTLKIRHASDTEDSWIWESMAQFQVDYFRKPEYSLEVGATNQTVVQGEGGEFILTGEYFSGQSLAGEDVSYTAYASSIYEYEYAQTWLEESIDTQYNYGLWSGDRVATGTVTLDSYGKAQVPLKELNIPASGSLRVITLEASYMDDSGNPVLARKNIILYPGNLSIYRAQGPYSGKVNQKYTLPIFLTARNSDSVARKPITATVTRRYWESQMVSGQKYPVYTYKDESLPEIQSQTDDQGKADLQVIPQKEGSYTVSVSVHDSERNVITKSFNFWINEYGSPWIMGQGEDQLTLSLDRATYDPGDEATVEIYSAIPDRDILVTVQRARVHRYVLVSLTGNFATIKLPIVDSDIPNVIVRANSFSTGAMQSATAPLTVARDSKRVAVTITSDKKVYGPGETVTLDIQTKDTTGDGVAAEVAVWSVDKALFELVDDTRKNIFEVFWAQRSDTTQESHSLKGINVQTAEKGGGCFVAGTAVTMADGSKRPIELVKVGESVLTRTSEQDAKLVSARVVGTHSVQESGYLILNGELQLTANHLIWVNDRWMEAGSVQVGDVLLDSDGKEVVVETVEWQQKAVTVYNLSVESQETFFAENIWVHNQKGSARTVFKDTAYWNPTVRTGIDGTARVQFKLPDNLTTWVIAGVAANERTQVGQTLSEIKVSKSLVVRPILPNIIRVGDELHASALINNFTGVEQKLDVDLTFSAGEVEQATHSAVTVIPNKPLQLAWKLKADREQSEAQITIAARGGSQDASDTVTTTMPVISYGFFEKSAGVGNGPATFPLSIPEDADPKHSNVRVALSPTMLGTLPTAMKYLIQYPYGCVEQTTSRFVPAVIVKANQSLFASSLVDKDLDAILQKGIERLSQLQQPDGGWGWWYTSSDLYITAYVVEYVVLAQQQGIEVPADMLERSRQFLLATNLQQQGQFRPLTTQEQVAKMYALSLLDDPAGKEPITDFGALNADLLAMAVMTNVRNGLTDPGANGLSVLLSMVQHEGETAFWAAGSRDHFGSTEASTALAIRAILAAQGDRTLAAQAARFLMEGRRRDYWANTYATAQVIRAITELAKTGSELTPNYTYKLLLDGNTVAEGAVTSAQQAIPEILIPASDLKSARGLELQQMGSGQLYSTVIHEIFHTDRESSAISRGMQIEREYISSKGYQYTLSPGDKVTVRLTISGLETDVSHLVVEDHLPAGLIPINTQFRNEQAGATGGYYFDRVSAREVTQDGMILSVQSVPGTTQTYEYQARVVAAGTFAVPPARAELMYTPEIQAYSAAETVTVTNEAEIIPKRAAELAAKAAQRKFDQLYARYKKLLPLAALFLFAVLLLVLQRKKNQRKLAEKSNVPLESNDATPKNEHSENEHENGQDHEI